MDNGKNTISQTLPEAADSLKQKTNIVTLGGGCFWCVEAVYQTVAGILKLTNGYAGGSTSNPTYEEVCQGQTGHAEVVQIVFDPAVISYEKVIDLFWLAHDPTTKDRQGGDHGTQYRSMILYNTEEERLAAEKSRAAAQDKFLDPIVTDVVKLNKFYPAEDYHQKFFQNNPAHPYIQAVTRPKVDKFIAVTEGKEELRVKGGE